MELTLDYDGYKKPKKKRILIDDKTLQKILDAYELKMTQKEAAVYSETNEGIVSRRWRKYGLEPHYKRNYIEAIESLDMQRPTVINFGVSESEAEKYNIKNEKQTKILEAYKLGLTTRGAAEYADTSKDTIRRYWNIWELSPNKDGAKISGKTLEKILYAHDKGLSITAAADYAGADKSTVTKYWKMHGLKPHNNRKRISEEKFGTITKLGKKGGSISEIARQTHVDRKVIAKHLEKCGIETLDIRIDREKLEKIFEAYELGMSIHKTARYANTTRITVRRYLEVYSNGRID